MLQPECSSPIVFPRCSYIFPPVVVGGEAKLVRFGDAHHPDARYLLGTEIPHD